MPSNSAAGARITIEMLSRKPAVPEDLQGIDATLRKLRPELPEDRARFLGMRARNRARVAALQSNHSKEPSLRSRLAILTMLVLGFAFSGAGVGLAVTGIATEGTSAADQQYDTPSANPTAPTLSPTVTPPANEVEGESDEGTNPGVAGDNEVAGADDEAPADTQDTRQLAVEQGGQELPFTGFAAIPVLLMGLALLTGGFLLRRRGTGSDSL